jgi:hypothetical protein
LSRRYVNSRYMPALMEKLFVWAVSRAASLCIILPLKQFLGGISYFQFIYS